MSTAPRSAPAVLEESFLEVRAKLLEVAASLDRIDRAAAEAGPLDDESQQRRQLLDEAARRLLDSAPERAASLQHLFSRDYNPDWRQQMNV